MSSTTEPDRCIKTEANVDGLSVYVIVVMGGDCPVEVQVSVVEREPVGLNHLTSALAIFCGFEDMVNEVLETGAPVSPLIKLLLSPPCKHSEIIGHALITALEA